MTNTNDNFNPQSVTLDGETPTLDVVLQSYIDAAIRDCRVWLPATIVEVLPGGTTQVTVQPTLLRIFQTLPAPVALPPLQNVPVVYPRGNSYGIKLPVAVGDPGIVLFCDRSLDIWKQQVAPAAPGVNPQSFRAHDLSDGIFIPGLFPLLAAPAAQTAQAGPLDLVLYNGLAQLLLQPGGTFMQGNGALETYALLVQTLTQTTALATATAASFTAFAAGAATDGTIPATGAAFTAAALALTPIIAALTTLTAGFTALAGVPGE